MIKAPRFEATQHEMYAQPQPAGEKASVFEHCRRAIDHALTRFGSHGLPLMGTGDWNDGMNRVGSDGKGESVWVGWFLYTILANFAELADSRHDETHAQTYRERAQALKEALNEHGWDGEWYRRAYFDDGRPLGSAQNTECRIDSLPQSWAVISSRADPERARQAVAAVDRLLVHRAERLVLLFTPPFDQGDLHPGYIRGYVP